MSDTPWDEGLKVLDKVYGPGSSGMMQGLEDKAMNREVVENQFRNLWGNDVMTLKEKRLMVLGATTMLGRQDLIETQMVGALINREFTEAELDHIPHFLLFYCGAGNCTALLRGIEAARTRVAAVGNN